MTKEKSIYNSYTYTTIRLLKINLKREEIEVEIENSGYKYKDTLDIFKDKYNRQYLEYENKKIYL